MAKKQKLGILTLSASDNCGSLLQAYALKHLLEPYGDVEIINFSTASSHRVYDIPCLSRKDKLWMAFSHDRRERFQSLSRCKEAYRDFRLNQLQMNDVEIFPDDLIMIKDKYDTVVVGSDQVWNVAMGDFDEAFFLGWVKGKKVAYAPSLGGSDIRNGENVEQMIEWIKSFAYISAREETGKRCLEEVSGRTVEKVLDPTLVLSEKEWVKQVGEPLIREDYIFYYSWAYRYEELLNIVQKESKRLGMPVIVIDSRKWMHRNEKKYGFILSKSEGPQSFLNLMYYAKHVYVESFHGMVFAYIFKKNFWLIDTSENIHKMDKRLREFVILLNAQERVLTIYNYNITDTGVRMHYSDNDSLSKLRVASEKYIQRALSI